MISESGKDFSQPAVYPYLLGSYACVNAVSDILLIIDGPKCAESKTEYLYGSGDIFSDLLDHSGRNRVVCTGNSPERMLSDPEGNIYSRVKLAVDARRPEACLVAAMPFAASAGMDYRRILGPLFSEYGIPWGVLGGSALSADWLSGYSDALAALAAVIRLPSRQSKAKKIIVAGNPVYRKEYDCLANIGELESLGMEIGARLALWPGGRSLSEDGKLFEGAAAVVGLPHGMEAGRIISRRMGIPFLPAPLPFGLEATGRFLTVISRFLGCSKTAGRVIGRKKDLVYRRCSRLVSAVISGNKAMCVIDPLLEPGLRDILSDLGVEAGEVIHTSRSAGGSSRVKTAGHVKRRVKELFPGECGLLISSNLSPFFVYLGGAYLEFGFPVYNRHCLTDSPFLGYSGFLRFTEQTANAILAAKKDPPYVV